MSVIYNILYSPTYRVPVLYFTGATPQAVAGTVSQGEHLITGEIWWFVHPCCTGDAMRVWEGAVGDEMGRYLGIWLGVVGGAAGLG
ncbi:hypothetical protein K440DRAFT_628470 [Wilcoxina mikolae CBS 423.85]|nr:hypothetical protein K440DRAFT_628470 [Wilcoxina mikolae CBS 423.85]